YDRVRRDDKGPGSDHNDRESDRAEHRRIYQSDRKETVIQKNRLKFRRERHPVTGKAVGNDFPAAFPVSLSFSICSMIPVCEVSWMTDTAYSARDSQSS